MPSASHLHTPYSLLPSWCYQLQWDWLGSMDRLWLSPDPVSIRWRREKPTPAGKWTCYSVRSESLYWTTPRRLTSVRQWRKIIVKPNSQQVVFIVTSATRFIWEPLTSASLWIITDSQKEVACKTWIGCQTHKPLAGTTAARTIFRTSSKTAARGI